MCDFAAEVQISFCTAFAPLFTNFTIISVHSEGVNRLSFIFLNRKSNSNVYSGKFRNVNN